MRILIANEPDMYREVIVAVLDELTPDIEIFASDPDDLEGEFLRVQPHLVVCSRATKTWSVRRPRGSSSTPVGTSHAVVKSASMALVEYSPVWTPIRSSPSWTVSKA